VQCIVRKINVSPRLPLTKSCTTKCIGGEPHFVAASLPPINQSSNQSINLSIKSSICKAPLKQSSRRRLAQSKEAGVKAWLELFSTNVSVLEMRWQHVPNYFFCWHCSFTDNIFFCSFWWVMSGLWMQYINVLHRVFTHLFCLLSIQSLGLSVALCLL